MIWSELSDIKLLAWKCMELVVWIMQSDYNKCCVHQAYVRHTINLRRAIPIPIGSYTFQFII